MQEAAIILLAMGLGHLLGDFALQTEGDVEGKQTLRWTAYLRHAAIHYTAVVVCLAGFASKSPGSSRVQVAVVLLTTAHTAIDLAKSVASRNRRLGSHPLALFLCDQAAHVVSILVVGWAILVGFPLRSFAAAFASLVSARALAVMVAYFAVVLAGGQLVRIALMPFARELVDESTGGELAYAGLYIGRLERFLILTAILAGSYTSVGLIVAAKSIFRFPNMKDRPFAEYFLIGTLVSVSVAVVGAVLLRWFMT